MQSKYWCFTINNWTEEEERALENIQDEADVTYIIWGKELSDTGTPHLQGYIEFSRRHRLQQLKRITGLRRSHIEPRRGSAQEAATYCRKDGQFREYGTISQTSQGKRNDLIEVRNKIKQRVPLSTIADDHFSSFVRYHKGILLYRNLQVAPRTWPMEVYIYWGPTGTGKTRKVYQECGDSLWAYSGSSWFDGYDGHEHVLFDDFCGGDFKISYLLKLLDRYPFKVPVKGSFMEWIPRRVWITSNLDPREWYPNAKEEHVRALFRRITQIIHFNQPLN